MARSIEQYLRMMPKASGLRCSENFWYPAADVYRTGEGWVVKLELAGVAPDELEVEISGDTLRVARRGRGRRAPLPRRPPRPVHTQPRRVRLKSETRELPLSNLKRTITPYG